MLACCLALLLAPRAEAAGSLLPDLKPLGAGPAQLCQEKPTVVLRQDACTGTGHTVIRTTTKTGDAGRGPLELVAVPRAQDIPEDCHGDGDVDINGDGVPDDNDVLVRQRVFNDANGDGVFERSIDTVATSHIVGCRYYHPIHHHYHLEAFVHFMVESAQTGKIVAGSNKVSFCLSDSQDFDLLLPGAPLSGYYSSLHCKPRNSVQGVSIGWADTYGWQTPGQEINITGLREADYCVITQTDPDDKLAESDETNNERRVRYHLDAATAPVNSSIQLKQVPGGCPAPISDTHAPGTTITKHPKQRVKTHRKKARVTFKFHSTEARSSFECQLDRGGLKSCSSPFKRKVKAGRKHKGRRHTFQVRATDPAGNPDPTAATFHFRVKRLR